MNDCPCGTLKNFKNCCHLFISHQKNPTTAEELMRSRYTAYTLGDMDYIAETMKAPAANHFDKDDTKKWNDKVTWTNLEVLKTTNNNGKGRVEFIASYVVDNKKNILHEISEFHFLDNKWYYVNGVQPEIKNISSKVKIGRNDTCPCGSNKKFKKCCGT